MKKQKNKVCIAMSGGVDSAVAAAILKKQGFECVGIFMKFWQEQETQIENKCCSVQAYDDARKVANRLGFRLYTLNFKQPFKKTVVDQWLKGHQKGNTPNPCIYCNQLIKFGLLLEKAKLLGCDYLATGHYVKIVTSDKRQETSEKYQKNLSHVSCRLSLEQARDKHKDQSYFLYTLTQDQLKYLIFPLGNYTKTEVRALAKKFKLPVYQKPESQEICFVPDKTHYPFLKRHLNLRLGPIKNTSGETIGRHEGLPLYTLGQRQGIKIGGTGPFYVVRLDYKTNTLVVSNEKDDPKLYTKKFSIKENNWIGGQPKWPFNCQVKIRYQAPSVKCQINKNQITLAKPQRAIMPGQSAVFYLGQKLLGGAIIDKI